MSGYGKIRACAIVKGVQICAMCSEYESCQLIHDFINGASEPRCNEREIVRTRMEWLRSRFLASSKSGWPGLEQSDERFSLVL